ncbi:MAG: serine/threonine-protein kinase [Mycobacteriales bacterium]
MTGDDEDARWSPEAAPARAARTRGDTARESAPAPMGLVGYADFTVVAEGGDSTVYRARQVGLDRDVAIKVVRLDDPGSEAWFRRELEITTALGRQHPHIVTVLDTGTTTGGLPCLVMEFYDRGSLHDWLRANGPLPVAEVVAAGTVVADALAFAHAQGVLHRDVKPQNILVLPTSYVLADFGIARRIDAGHTGSVDRFSYRHAAPQVLDGEPPSVADDVYSLGSTLYTLLDGRPPFAPGEGDSDSALAYLSRVRTQPARPLRRADVPPELVAVIDRCLAKRREDRYPDAGQLRAALAAVVATGTPVPAAKKPPPAADEAAPPAAAVAPPVAPSALVHVPQDPAEPDWLDATGAPPDAATGRPAPAGEPAEPTGGRPGWRRPVRIVAAALVAGAIVGAAVAAVHHRSNSRHGGAGPGPTPTGGPVPTFSSTPPPPTQAAGSNPALAPTLTVTAQGGTASLHWTDPSGGRATFVIVHVVGTQAQAVRQLPPGTTRTVVDGVGGQPAQRCFQILAIVAGDRGVSPLACAGQ